MGIMSKKIKVDVLKRLIEMRDSDELYERWMEELEIKAENRPKKNYVKRQNDHPLISIDLINKCLYSTLLCSMKMNGDNFLKTT